MIDERNPALEALFADARQELPGESFTAEVMAQTDSLKYRRIARRIAIGVIFALAAVPLQDTAMILSQLFVTTLFEIEDGLVAELLAPVNTVGGLMSFVLLALRAAHRRLFTAH